MNEDLRHLEPPSAERLQRLPLWAQEWINTLVFEVRWLRDQAESTPKPQHNATTATKRHG